jgi:hypothetical protein
MGLGFRRRLFARSAPMAPILALACLSPALAQEPSLADTVSLSSALTQTRIQAMADLKAGGYEQAWRLPESLAARFPGETFLLYRPEEEVVLALATRHWGPLLDPQRWNRPFSTFLEGKQVPDKDGFPAYVDSLFWARSGGFEADLEREAMEPYQREFIRLLYLDNAPPSHPPPRTWLNRRDSLVEDWLERYPDKPYARKVGDDFRLRWEPVWIGFGGEIILTQQLPFGGFGRVLDPGPAFGFGVELMLHRISLRAQVLRDGYTKLNRDLGYLEGTWPAGRGYELTYAEFQAGAEAWRSWKGRIIPFVSLGAVQFTNGNLRDGRLDKGEDPGDDVSAWEICPGFGAHMQYLFEDQWESNQAFAGVSAGMRFPRLDRTFRGFSGGEAFLEFRFGYTGRGWRRVL